jgi:predicted dehydrogenase
MKELKIGILGYGAMGHYHSVNVKEKGVSFVSACDIEAMQLEDAVNLGLKTFLNDEKGFFNDPEINTVLLTVPNHLHHKYAIMAAEHGKNIICEKPAALSVAEFDEMTGAAERNNVLFTVHQNRRWDKDYLIAKKIFRDKLIGDVFGIESTLHMVSGNTRAQGWHVFKKYGGGMVYDWSVHQIDQVLDMCPGKIETVFADLKSIFVEEVEDYFKVIIRMESGVTITLSLCTYCLKASPRWLLLGNEGTGFIKNFAGEGNYYNTTKKLKKLSPRIEPSSSGPTRSYKDLMPGELVTSPLPEVDDDDGEFYRNYIDVLNGTGEFIVKKSEARRVLAVIEAIKKSHETKSSIPFDYDKQ